MKRHNFINESIGRNGDPVFGIEYRHTPEDVQKSKKYLLYPDVKPSDGVTYDTFKEVIYPAILKDKNDFRFKSFIMTYGPQIKVSQEVYSILFSGYWE